MTVLAMNTNTPFLTDRDLVDRVLQGSPDVRNEAFSELFHRHADDVMATTLRMLGDKAAAEDALNEAFLNALLKLDTLKTGESFKSWLTTIATRKALAQLRKRSRSPLFPSQSKDDGTDELRAIPEPEYVPTTPETIDAKHFIEHLKQKVDPEQFEAFRLKNFEGYTLEEIAELLDSNPSTLHRWIKKVEEAAEKLWRKTNLMSNKNKNLMGLMNQFSANGQYEVASLDKELLSFIREGVEAKTEEALRGWDSSAAWKKLSQRLQNVLDEQTPSQGAEEASREVVTHTEEKVAANPEEIPVENTVVQVPTTPQEEPRKWKKLGSESYRMEEPKDWTHYTAEERISTAKMRSRTHSMVLYLLTESIGTEVIDQVSTTASAANDGRRIYFNRKYVELLSLDALSEALIHQALHVVFGHSKHGDRDPKRWNLATDLFVSHLLWQEGIALRGATLPDTSLPITEEKIYNELDESLPAHQCYQCFITTPQKSASSQEDRAHYPRHFDMIMHEILRDLRWTFREKNMKPSPLMAALMKDKLRFW
jgi:RNA polymerase sigma-70 factor (ECF subfamily)